MATLVSVIVMLLLGNIVNWLLSVCSDLSSGILATVSAIFSSTGENPLTNITNLISNNLNISGFKLDQVIFIIALSLIVVEVALGALNSITSEMTGKRTENPWNVLANGFFAVLLIALFFGTSSLTNYTITNNGILSFIAEYFGKLLSIVFKESTTLSSNITVTQKLNLTPSQYVLILILTGGILGSILSGAISIVERVFQLAAFIFLGPFALSLYASSGSRDCASNWIKGIISQYICLGLSVTFWCASMTSLQKYLSLDKTASASVGITSAVTCVVLFSLAENSEELLSVIGFKTMRPMDAARMVGSGLHTAMHVAQTTEGFIGQAAKDAPKVGKGLWHAPGKVINGASNGLSALTNTLNGNIMASKISDSKNALEKLNNVKDESGKKVIGDKAVLGNTNAKNALNLAEKLGQQTINSPAINTGLSALEGMSALSAATGSNLRDQKTNGLVNPLSNSLSSKPNTMAVANGIFENSAGKRIVAPVAYAKKTDVAKERDIAHANNEFASKCAENDGQWLVKDTKQTIETTDIGKQNGAGEIITAEMVQQCNDTKREIFEKNKLISEEGQIVREAGEKVADGEMFIISPETQSMLQKNGFTINDLKSWNETDVAGSIANISFTNSSSDANKLAGIISDKSSRKEGLRSKLNQDIFGENTKQSTTHDLNSDEF